MKKTLLISILLFSLRSISQTGTWTPLVSGTSVSLLGVSAPSPNICYVAGGSGTILKTIDGGTTWTPQTSGTGQTINSLYFIDIDTGYAASNAGVALKTTNGGATWSQMTTGSSSPFRCIWFTSPTTGYIMGGSGSGEILKTTNCGATWSSTSISSSVLYGTYFTSLTNGYTVDYNGLVVKTINGGTSWTTISSGPTEIFADVRFINSTTGFIVGRNGTIRKTTDSGATWVNVTSGTTDALSAINFVNSTDGFIIGGPIPTPAGTILSTTDAGATWTSYSPGSAILIKMSFPNANIGYVVGYNGTILKYNSSVGIKENEKPAQSFNCYPNPFIASTTIDCKNHTFEHAVFIELYDITGKIVKDVQFSSNKNTIVIEKNDLAPGFYTYKVYDGKTIVGIGNMIAQ